MNCAKHFGVQKPCKNCQLSSTEFYPAICRSMAEASGALVQNRAYLSVKTYSGAAHLCMVSLHYIADQLLVHLLCHASPVDTPGAPIKLLT